ncbi:hypothetical protein [Pseudoalteromonas spongiae]|uniref:hypothetical protein n=1 Tax=Pseudoalteromonas spongiae TaxID=298657 RepID=UPI00110B9B7E|nr:hypothetical protein [Pseudoalteromonas spongiae]TMO84850.1 hypothetical protein CWC15_09710 [Pseudoalteromonas spongiae]
MSDPANILIKRDENDHGVYLYSHWGANTIEKTLQDALKRNLRWDDPAYLARIIFDEMTKGEQGEEVGFGISSYLIEGNVIQINVRQQTIKIKDEQWSFQEYIKLTMYTW